MIKRQPASTARSQVDFRPRFLDRGSRRPFDRAFSISPSPSQTRSSASRGSKNGSPSRYSGSNTTIWSSWLHLLCRTETTFPFVKRRKLWAVKLSAI